MNTRPTGAAHVIEAPQLGLATDQRSASTRQLLSDYVELTKPKVQSLLLLTTIATMYVAGNPSLLLVALTCLGGYLSAGGAGAVNHWYDRDIDARMARTATRPVPSGRVAPNTALAFGCTLAALSFLELSLTVNVLAASLSFAGFLGYVFLYTIWLKRRTPQNIVIGGAAGAVPVLVGWAAVTDSLSWTPVVMFAIIFVWTPPHFWALAVKYKDDYQAASVPMLPAVATFKRTAREILLYSVLLVGVSLLLAAVARLGTIYVVSAAVLGVVFVAMAIRLLHRQTAKSAMQLFSYSITYLTLLFVFMAVDIFTKH
jgi:heme o synthase